MPSSADCSLAVQTPALEKDDFKLTESVAIALYLAYYENKSGLVGADKEQNALVQQWAAWANVALMAGGLGPWFRPLNGSLPYNKAGVEAAKAYTLKQLNYLEAFLADKTFLVGERITIADIFVASVLARGFELVLDAEVRATIPNVLRHFNTVVHQEHFLAVLGGEPTLVEKAITFTPPKKEAKPEQPKKEAPKPKAAETEEAEEAAPAEPKAAHPVAALGNAKSWPLDEFKRQYSNNETPVAFKWLKDNWTAEAAQEYSLWRADYKYNDELTQVFMSSNLITGFHTRLEGSRKVSTDWAPRSAAVALGCRSRCACADLRHAPLSQYLMGSAGVYGTANQSVIAGAYLIRGQNITDVVSVGPDYTSFDFTPLSLDNEADAKFILEAFSWTGDVDGKPFADGKVMK